MIPHQIYCDYLEDKGIDTRLLRIMESEGFSVTNSSHFYATLVPIGLYNGDGLGYGLNYLDHHGEDEGDGYGYGWAYGLLNGSGVNIVEHLIFSMDK